MTMNRQQTRKFSDTTPAPDTAPSPPRTVTSGELFGASRQLVIRHAGEEYRLSITSKDKLILTK